MSNSESKTSTKTGVQSIVHTPGPWRTGRAGCVVADTPVPEMGGSEHVEYYGGHMVCESVTTANARLIALAPEMLEFAESFVREWEAEWFEPDEVSHEWQKFYAQAKALVRKVKSGHQVV